MARAFKCQMLRHLTTAALLCGASGQALAQTAPASAPAGDQATPATPSADATADGGADIIVTGSRTIVDGRAAPTPVTVVSADQLVAANPGNMADALNQLPEFRGGPRPASAGSAVFASGAGANLLALRGLSAFRTLVLMDGQRIVPTTLTGATDANLIPQNLVRRVDVVTGGASAAYGSDAVAGVVNFVLDKNYTGLKGYLQGGLSTRGDAGTQKANITFGRSFLDGRLHFIASADYFFQDAIDQDYGGRRWADSIYGLIGESATSSALVLAPDTRLSNASFGGVITACQPTAAACPIRNQRFTPSGSLVPFQLGNNVTASTMSGGDGAYRRVNLVPGLESQNGFARIGFDVSDSLSIFVQGTYGHSKSRYYATDTLNAGTGGFTIYNDNAYLSQALRTTMAANGITSFSLGRASADLGGIFYNTNSNVYRLAGGLEGRFGNGWSWNMYAQYGRNHLRILTENNSITENLYNAVDAVINPATGQPICRSTLLGTVAGANCVPINLFGEGAPSTQAIDYVTTTSRVDLYETQFVAAADVRGSLLTLPGGAMTVATGLEYRRETGRLTTDPLGSRIRTGDGIRGYPAAQKNLPGSYYQNPPQPLSGSFSVREGFVEINAPLLKNVPLVRSLDLNGAVRYADYSSVGGVTTWKAGASWQPVEDLRLRATRSRDIRAPNIEERFTSATQINGIGVNDPQRGGARVVVIQRQVGNLGLREETADTLSLGAVFTPKFLPGLSASVDYFDIKINNVIAQPTPQNIVDSCGTTCDLVLRNADGTINTVITPNLNLARLRTRGEDYELRYTTALGDGRLTLRALATHTRELSLTRDGVTIDRVGDLNVTPSTVPPAGVKWSGALSANFRSERWNLYAQERYISGGSFDKTMTYSTATDTRVPEVFYTDVTLGFVLPTRSRKMELYATINNLFDRDPPITPNGALTAQRSANGSLYDFIGRNITAGLRVEF